MTTYGHVIPIRTETWNDLIHGERRACVAFTKAIPFDNANTNGMRKALLTFLYCLPFVHGWLDGLVLFDEPKNDDGGFVQLSRLLLAYVNKLTQHISPTVQNALKFMQTKIMDSNTEQSHLLNLIINILQNLSEQWTQTPQFNVYIYLCIHQRFIVLAYFSHGTEFAA